MTHVHDLQVVMSPIDEIEQHPENANTSDMEALDESIETNGFYQPLIVQASTGYILSGNHRWAAMLARGATEVPTIFLDVDDEAARRIMIADNRITRLGQDDPALLGELLDKLAATDAALLGTGFSHGEFQSLMESLEERLEFESEPPVEKKSKKGADLYHVYPERDEDGQCSLIIVEPKDGEPFSAADFNRIRQALGLKRETENEIMAYDIAGWVL